ncbi:oligomeric Golgi complex subunit 7 [Phlyctochytrium arcticum]|nr:oligomeric Golgi complex subunit 7 [Phlyctochytrium arcticum]
MASQPVGPERRGSSGSGGRVRLERALSVTGSAGSPSSFGLNVEDFLDPAFSVKDWINKALSTNTGQASNADAQGERPSTAFLKREDSFESASGPPPTSESSTTSKAPRPGAADGATPSIEQTASNLVLKLQLLSLDISNKFEQLSEEAVKNVPRTLYDLEQISTDAHKVRAAIDAARKTFDQADRGTGPAFKDLVKLDLVRNRMVATRLSLKEAESWTTLAGEMDAIFAARDFEKASLRLEGAEKSLAMLTATPDYEERKAMLGTLKNRLQTSLSPILVAACNESDAEAVRKLFLVYERMGRSDDFFQIYNKSRTAPLTRLWQQYDEEMIIRIAVSGNEGELATWYSEFYDEVLAVLKKELSWCSFIFPHPPIVLLHIIHDLYNSLQPTAGSRLRGYTSRVKDRSLASIVKMYQATVQFGVKVETMLSLNANEADHHVPRSPTRSEASHDHTSLESNRSHHSASRSLDLEAWGTMVFEPFSSFQQAYDKHERNYLMFTSASFFASSKRSDYMESTRVMADSVPRVFSLADSAVARCRIFTNGFGTALLVDSLNEYFAATFDRYIAIVNQLRTDIGLDKSDLTVSIAPEDDEDNEFRAGEGERQEWGNFQVGLRLLGLCSTVHAKLDSFKRQLFASLGPVLRRRLDANWSTSSQFWEDEREHSEECWAVYKLLSTSTLNSLKLRKLADALDADLNASNIPGGQQNVLFAPAASHLKNLTLKSQRFVFDTLFSVLEKQLHSVPEMEVWNSSTSKTAGPFNLDVPQFSLSPLPYITRVGEHLLTLPQQLELYIDDDALKFSIDTLPYLSRNDSRPPTTDGAIDGDDVVEDVAHLWISSVSRGAMTTYCDAIIRIVRLSPHGAKQLATDVGYITNVFAAMDIEPIPQLWRLHSLLSLPGADIRAKYALAIQKVYESKDDEFTFGDEKLVQHLLGALNIDLP